MIQSSKYPILEFDDDQNALIEPSQIIGKYKPLPDKLIITFFKEVILSLLESNEIKHHITIRGENNLDIYVFKDQHVAMFHGIIGSAACAGFLEECIALGVKHVMFCGGAGALVKDMALGNIVIVDKAIRDEGLSYHYLKPSRYAYAQNQMVNLISQKLDLLHVSHVIGTTWTTDAFYRETKAKIQKRIQDGAILVEMEQAGLLAVCKFRHINYGAMIYSGDDVSGDVWDSRGWHHRLDIRMNLVKLCYTLLIELNEVFSWD